MTEPMDLQAPVVEVTLSEDRAQVARRAQLHVDAGLTRLRIAHVASVLVDKTLGVSATGASVAAAYVQRLHLYREADRPDDVRELRRLLREKKAEERRLQSEREENKAHAECLAKLAEQSMAEIAEDASWEQGVPDTWETSLQRLQQDQLAARQRVADLDLTLAELAEAIADVEARRLAADNPAAETHAALSIDVQAEAAADVDLDIEYIVPGACWRPYHEAQLLDGKVLFRSDACVWQNTGEDWQDVTLHLSTERPSLGTRPPLLDEDVLRAHKVDSTIVVESREQQIFTAGLGTGGRPTRAQVPGIDDGGEPLQLTVAGPVSVPSDGRPHRAELSRFESPAEVELVCMPELEQAVLLRTRQNNAGAAPILAGPVDLIRDSGLVGRTSVLFVAPGEKLELGWGPEADLRVQRRAETLDEESHALSSWHTSRRRVETLLSNLGGEERSIQLTERIPVSEIEKLRIAIEPNATSGQVSADRDGFVRWTLHLSAFAHETVQLGYTVERHSDVVGLQI